MEIPGFDLLDEFTRLGPFVVLRGRRTSDQRPVLLQVPQPGASRAAIEVLERQVALLTRVAVAGSPCALEFVRYEDGAGLVMDDAGLTPLARVLRRGRVDLIDALGWGSLVCAHLRELHAHDITHGSINPSALLVDPGGSRLEVIGAGALTAVAEPGAAPLGRVTPYTSPEQTGRMNRTVDYRTDFYSLGATLYELFTGAPPFVSDDPLELIHGHIARTPATPTLHDPAIPPQLSAIVARLMAKAAEDRYQSAMGVKHDLDRCRHELSATGTVRPFDLGAADVTHRFLISQKLYGRERELRDLLLAFDATCDGAATLMLVSGYSGIGKTSFIHELYKPIVRQRGYFISGKFDQVVRNIPYGAFTQAVRNLVWQLLTEPEHRLASWRARLSDVLGANGGVLAEVIPEIELILGKQPPAPPLDPAEAKNRFGYVFQAFVGALARREHPLVVFLDDLQWADVATLDLLHSLLTAPGIEHLLIIGAYRDNEVDDANPLTWAVKRLETASARVARVSLGPLELPELTTFLADTLHREPAYVEPLAVLIKAKTDGNPFFVIQFLTMLEQEGLIAFDAVNAGWSFSLAAIGAAGITDNVVDLMTRKIRRLSQAAQHVLTMAACVGSQFARDIVLAITEQPAGEVVADLLEAQHAGLIHEIAQVPEASGDHVRTTTYSFLHDRVQQAAYGLIPKERKRPVHLQVGRLLLADLAEGDPDDRIFATVNHLNIGADLIEDAAERMAVLRLNVMAARKARTSAAFHAALGYFTRAAAMAVDSMWSDEHDLMFSLHLDAAECHYLTGDFAAAEDAFRQLLARVETRLERALIHCLRITLFENQSRWAEAIAAGREGLALFDIAFPDTADARIAALDAEVAAVQNLVRRRSIASLIDSPVMVDPAMRMVMRILTALWAPAYICGDVALARLISARMVRLSITHGLTEDSAYGYVTHAITVGPVRKDYQSAHEWGTLALDVNQRFDDLKRRAKIHQQFQAHVNLWCRPLETCIGHAREAARSGLQAGDFTYAGYGAATEAWSAFLISRSLEQFVRDYTPTLALLEKVRLVDFAGAHRVLLNWARALQGRTAAPLSLSDDGFDEQQFIDRHVRDAPFFLTFVYVARLHLHVLLENRAAAVTAANDARAVAMAGTIWPVLVEFWGGLAAAAACDESSATEWQTHHDTLVAAQGALVELANACPENFRGMSLLLSAERCRVNGRLEEAVSLATEAVAYAQQTGNLQQEGLANERCARVWLQLGDQSRARSLLAEAHRCYSAWGAVVKTAQLETRYADLLAKPLAATAAARTVGALRSLDIATVLKVAHAIAVEIEVGGLLRKLLSLTLENAGAQRGVFVGERDGTLMIEAKASADLDTVSLETTPLDQCDDVAVSIVRYVHRTGRDVVTGDATIDERFAADAYLARTQAKSVLCVPVAHQGRWRGMLYLENNLTSDAFTPERLELMRILAAQAAISLENARLYETMKQEVERRTDAERALRAALDEVQALKNRLEAENVYLQEEIRTHHNFDEIVGQSPALVDALHKVERVAMTDSTVLIVGETGTGKELFARAVHNRSRRSGRPLVKVNCGAIPPGLVESELFGHVKGAFTGAIDKRVGRFELANGGTIFLDEIGELPLDAQVKLLRVLQEQEFEPVGSSKTVRVNVRVIAATNRDLDQAAREGKFRADLLYRLNVFPIDVPPLRDRRSDIPLLAGFFVSGLARRIGKSIQGFSGRSIDRLCSYSWPGNVRELQNIVERAAILARGPVLELEGTILAEAPSRALPTVTSGSDVAAAAMAAESLNDIQRLHILNVLKSTGGVVEGARGAATILGMHPNTLRSRMKKLGITATPRNAPS